MKLPRNNIKSWAPWIEKINNNEVDEVLAATPEIYIPVVSGTLTTAKWHPGRPPDERGIGICAYCELYDTDVEAGRECLKCPYYLLYGYCVNEDNLWYRWIYSTGEKRHLYFADRLYLALYRIFAAEWRKLFG